MLFIILYLIYLYLKYGNYLFYFQYLYLYDVIGNGKAMEELYVGHIY